MIVEPFSKIIITQGFQNILMTKIQGIAFCLGHWRNGPFLQLFFFNMTFAFSIFCQEVQSLCWPNWWPKRFWTKMVTKWNFWMGFYAWSSMSFWFKCAPNGAESSLQIWRVLRHSQDTPQVHIVPAWLSHFWRNKRNKINEGISMCLPSWCCCPPSRILYNHRFLVYKALNWEFVAKLY